MRFRLPNGRLVIITYHTPAEWGELLAAKIRLLGCSEEYCAAVAEQYAAAEPV